MYDETEGKKRLNVDWFGLAVKLVILVAIVFLIFWIVPKFTNKSSNKNTTTSNETFNTNIKTMKDAAKSYYTIDRLPEKIGDSTTMTLEQMLNNKFIIPFTDSNGEYCNAKNSYVKVTKQEEDKYAMKVQLSCNDHSDYILETIGCYDVCLDGSKSNDNKNYFTVTFDSQGGSSVASQSVLAGGFASKPSNPTKSGYTFAGWYLDNGSYNFNTAVNSNITLVAKWTKNSSGTGTKTTTNTTTTKTTETIEASTTTKKRYYVWQKITNTYTTTNVDYYSYCENVSKTYYSVTYGSVVGASANWTIQLLDIPANAKSVSVSGPYAFTDSDYNNYNDSTSRNNVHQKGSNGAYDVYVPSGMLLYNASIKPGSYTAYFTDAVKYASPYWEVPAYMRINSLSGAYMYNGVYFVPFKYYVSYISNSCVIDKHSANYPNYTKTYSYTKQESVISGTKTEYTTNITGKAPGSEWTLSYYYDK